MQTLWPAFGIEQLLVLLIGLLQLWLMLNLLSYGPSKNILEALISAWNFLGSTFSHIQVQPSVG